MKDDPEFREMVEEEIYLAILRRWLGGRSAAAGLRRAEIPTAGNGGADSTTVEYAPVVP